MSVPHYRLYVLAGSVLLFTFLSAAAETMSLVHDGKSAYSIVLHGTASPSEENAALELQTRIKQCCHAELPILHAVPEGNTPMIVLGCGSVADALGVKPSPEALGEQGYVIRAVGPHLVIAGTAAAGTLYGVYDFVEEFLGVRWYAPVSRRPRNAPN